MHGKDLYYHWWNQAIAEAPDPCQKGTFLLMPLEFIHQPEKQRGFKGERAVKFSEKGSFKILRF